jgi:hypothetical protein
MLPEFVKFIRLLMIIPVSAATPERLFSSLRRLKTYLRSTTTLSQLNTLALLNIQSDLTTVDKDKIDFI